MRPALALICCGLLALPAAANARPLPVYVQGDSLTAMSRDLLRQQLPGYRLRISAQVGRHADQGLELMRRRRHLGRIVVFALGTNDNGYAHSWWDQQLRRVRHRVGPRRCLVLQTVYVHGPVGWMNRRVRALAGPRVVVADWSAQVSRGKARLADGVHPADRRSQRRWAATMADAVRRCRSRL